MFGPRWAHQLRALFLLLSSLLAACAVTPQAEKRAMQAELRSEIPRVVQMADLSSKAYLTPDVEPQCPKLISARPKIECFRVPIPHSLKGYEAVYLIETDDHAQEQVVAI